MFLQGRTQTLWQHRHPILRPLAVPDQDFSPVEIHILHPQPHAFHEAHSRPIQKPRHQSISAMHPGQCGRHLGTTQDHRQTRRTLGAHHLIHPRQFDIQDFPIQKQERRKRLILRRRRDLAVDRQIRQKRRHLHRPHLARMAFAMKQHKTPNPLDILRLGSYAVMPQTNLLTQLIEQFQRPGGVRRGDIFHSDIVLKEIFQMITLSRHLFFDEYTPVWAYTKR